MKLTNIIEEDFVNYRKPGMFLGFPYCSGKCNSPGRTVCQNEELRCVPEQDLIDISPDEITDRYLKNPITKCLICGGLEPFDSFKELFDICYAFRKVCGDPVVIYTGFYPFEIIDKLRVLGGLQNIFVKFGRFIPGDTPHRDPVLGVDLASDNQFGMYLEDALEGFTW